MVRKVAEAKAAWKSAQARSRKVAHHAAILSRNPYPSWRNEASDIERQLHHARLRRLAITRELDKREATLAAAGEKLETAKQNHKRLKASNKDEKNQFSVQQAAEDVGKKQADFDAIAPRFDALQRECSELGEKMEALQPEHDRLQAQRLEP